MTAEKLNGVWKLKTSENFDGYMKAIGVNMAKRALAKVLKPTLTVEIKDNSVHLKNVNAVRSMEIRCTIDEEWDEQTPDGRKCKSVMYWDGDKLVQVQKWDGKQVEVTRFMEDDLLIVNFVVGDVVAKLIYEKH